MKFFILIAESFGSEGGNILGRANLNLSESKSILLNMNFAKFNIHIKFKYSLYKFIFTDLFFGCYNKDNYDKK